MSIVCLILLIFVAHTILNLFWEGYCINFCLISLEIISRIHLTKYRYLQEMPPSELITLFSPCSQWKASQDSQQSLRWSWGRVISSKVRHLLKVSQMNHIAKVHTPLCWLQRELSSAPKLARVSPNLQIKFFIIAIWHSFTKDCEAAQFSTIREFLPTHFCVSVHTRSSLGEAECLILPKKASILPDSPISFYPSVML